MSQASPSSIDEVIADYLRHGYHVVSQTATSAQLVKPKRFSALLFVLLFLLCLLPAVIYAAIYVGQSDEAAHFQITPAGVLLNGRLISDKRPWTGGQKARAGMVMALLVAAMYVCIGLYDSFSHQEPTRMLQWGISAAIPGSIAALLYVLVLRHRSGDAEEPRQLG